jgi:hypothetical protein
VVTVLKVCSYSQAPEPLSRRELHDQPDGETVETVPLIYVALSHRAKAR